jgi:hypothetical protein
MGMVTGIFGAIALGAIILGLVWWMRSLDRSKGRPGNRTEGVSAAFKRGDSDLPRKH